MKKEEVAETLKDVVAMLERQLGLKLKKIWLDNITEFVNKTIVILLSQWNPA